MSRRTALRHTLGPVRRCFSVDPATVLPLGNLDRLIETAFGFVVPWFTLHPPFFRHCSAAEGTTCTRHEQQFPFETIKAPPGSIVPHCVEPGPTPPLIREVPPRSDLPCSTLRPAKPDSANEKLQPVLPDGL